MNEIYFLVRYIPFWAVPVFLIGGEFAYLFYMRKKIKRFLAFLAISLFSLLSIVFYYWAGGPERSVEFIADIVRYYS